MGASLLIVSSENRRAEGQAEEGARSQNGSAVSNSNKHFEKSFVRKGQIPKGQQSRGKILEIELSFHKV